MLTMKENKTKTESGKVREFFSFWKVRKFQYFLSRVRENDLAEVTQSLSLISRYIFAKTQWLQVQNFSSLRSWFHMILVKSVSWAAHAKCFWASLDILSGEPWDILGFQNVTAKKKLCLTFLKALFKCPTGCNSRVTEWNQWVMSLAGVLSSTSSCIFLVWQRLKPLVIFCVTQPIYHVFMAFNLHLVFSTLRLQKRLASAVLKCGKNKIWLDPNETNEIANANSSKWTLEFLISISLS